MLAHRLLSPLCGHHPSAAIGPGTGQGIAGSGNECGTWGVELAGGAVVQNEHQRQGEEKNKKNSISKLWYVKSMRENLLSNALFNYLENF